MHLTRRPRDLFCLRACAPIALSIRCLIYTYLYLHSSRSPHLHDKLRCFLPSLVKVGSVIGYLFLLSAGRSGSFLRLTELPVPFVTVFVIHGEFLSRSHSQIPFDSKLQVFFDRVVLSCRPHELLHCVLLGRVWRNGFVRAGQDAAFHQPV